MKLEPDCIVESRKDKNAYPNPPAAPLPGKDE